MTAVLMSWFRTTVRTGMGLVERDCDIALRLRGIFEFPLSSFRFRSGRHALSLRPQQTDATSHRRGGKLEFLLQMIVLRHHDLLAYVDGTRYFRFPRHIRTYVHVCVPG